MSRVSNPSGMLMTSEVFGEVSVPRRDRKISHSRNKFQLVHYHVFEEASRIKEHRAVEKEV
jgi:hypothetical protein